MAKIIEFNGENVEFPDDMSDEAIGQVLQQQHAVNESGMTQEQVAQKLPVRNQATGMPEGMPLPYGVTQEMLDASNKDVARMNEQTMQQRSNPDFLKQVKQSSDEGFLANMGKSALNVMNSFGEGAEDLVDKYLPESVARTLNQRPFAGDNKAFEMTSDQRIADRAQRMAESNQEQSARNVGAPVSATVGSMLPYLATGEALGKGVEAVASAVSPITKQLIQKGLNVVSPSEAQRFASTPKIASDFGRRATEIAKAPAIGATEGGLNYNQSAGEGAMLSTGGALLGLVGPLSRLSKVENVRDANSRKIISDMHAEGFSLTPGVRSGNRQMQTEEAGMRNSDVMGDYYHQAVTRPNQRKMTELAGDAIGLDGKGRDSFSSQELSGHLDNLSSQYKNLEANTRGIIGADQTKRMGNVLKDLQPTANRNTTAADATRYETVKSIVTQMWKESNPVSRPGAKTVYQFDGSKYQQYRQRLQDEATQAFQNGDRRLGNSLNEVKQSLDDSLTNGMSKATANEWKDLNERYAMTNLLMKNGMTPTGAINPMGVTSAVMNGDEAIRTLTGKGGRIQKLQKIAKYNDVLNDVEGGSLTGLGGADYSADRSLAKLPLRYKLPLYARATGAYRLSRLPTYGLGATAGIKAGRALGMTNPLEKVSNAASLSAEGFRDWIMNGGKEENQ